MKRYELMVVVAADFDVEGDKKGEELVKKLVGDARLAKLTSLGKKTLAYPINKQTEGVYLLAELESETLRVGDIEKQARLNEVVLRYLLTKKEQVQNRKEV